MSESKLKQGKSTPKLSRRDFLRGVGLMTGGAALASLAFGTACRGTDVQTTSAKTSNPATTSQPGQTTTKTTGAPAGTNTPPASSTATKTSAPPPMETTTAAASGTTPPPPGQYAPPAEYPMLIETWGCTTRVAGDRWYTIEHVWVKELGGNEVVIGISDKMQALTDTITKFSFMYKVGDTASRGDIFAGLEAYKLNTDLYLPVSGKVLQVNLAVQAMPGTINSFPYTTGWMMVLQLTKPQEMEDLLGPQYYAYLQAKVPVPTVPDKRS